MDKKNNFNGATPDFEKFCATYVYKNPLADYDGTPVPHTEEDDIAYEEMLEKLEEAQARWFDPLLWYDIFDYYED